MKRSRFFCENCHREVRPSAKVCPHCGRFFEAVRCPVCEYTGDGREFVRGCPNCGYAGAETGTRGLEAVEFTRDAPPPARKTPPWVWPLALVIMVIAFAALAIIYLSL